MNGNPFCPRHRRTIALQRKKTRGWRRLSSCWRWLGALLCATVNSRLGQPRRMTSRLTIFQEHETQGLSNTFTCTHLFSIAKYLLFASATASRTRAIHFNNAALLRLGRRSGRGRARGERAAGTRAWPLKHRFVHGYLHSTSLNNSRSMSAGHRSSQLNACCDPTSPSIAPSRFPVAASILRACGWIHNSGHECSRASLSPL